MSNRNIVMSILDGRTIRDLFYNGLVEGLKSVGYEKLTIFTEAIHVKDFTKELDSSFIELKMLHDVPSTKWRTRAFSVRKNLAKTNKFLLKRWLKFEEKTYYKPPQDYVDFFQTNNPKLLLITHAHLLKETELISAAHINGTPTLGIVRSWDNVYKGINSRPQKMTVWNKINKEELIRFDGYDEKNIIITGAPQFDQYFIKSNIISKSAFCLQKGLDINRPIIFFASLGYFFAGNDETEWMDRLIELLDAGKLKGNPQIICRLHPWSRYEHFEKYKHHPSVILSYCNRYWPSLTWYMTKEDMIDMANMLNHCDVVITPGSTVVLEAAIFDKPTIVPIFHTYQPERMKNYFNTWVLDKHYGRIEKLDLVPIIKKLEEFEPIINRCLEDKSWYVNGRKQLIKDYIHFTDGKSTERIVELASRYLP